MLAAVVALALATDPSVQLAALSGRYRDYDLPLPPKDARLYRLIELEEGKPRSVVVGFALTSTLFGRPDKLLVGLEENEWHTGEHRTEAELTPTNWVRQSSYDKWSEWLVAIQCEVAGQHELAMTAWHAFTKSGGNPANVSDFLAVKAWKWWVERFQCHNADRAKVARRLQLIANDSAYAADAELLRKLKLSLQPTDAKSGSVEVLLDELLDLGEYWELRDDENRDPRLYAIVHHGFDAVPALIDHLDDDRLTRNSTTVRSINFGIPRAYPYSVKHFARDILYRLMADDERHRGEGDLLTKKDALAWWAEAKKEGEEAYLVRQVVDHCDNKYLLAVIGHKYPKRFPDIFEALRKAKPAWIDLRPLVASLVRSSLSIGTKTEVLVELTKSGDDERQAAALCGLHQIAPDEFHKRLIAVLADLSPEVDQAKRKELYPGGHTCIAEVAKLTDDAKVWAAVGKYLAVADPEVKMDWVHELTFWPSPEDKCYRGVVGCVAALLDDDSFRALRSGEKVSFQSVRNDVAEQLGRMLHVKTEPDSHWTDDEWRDFRGEVAKAAKKVIDSKK